MRYLSLREAKQVTGLCGNTLRKYADNGRIPHYRLPNGDRRFDVSSFVQQRRGVVGYARVSTRKQLEDLQRQSDYLKLHHPQAEIVQDIGSGLNFKRKGLQAILERVLRGESVTLVVTYRDRLARFGFDLIEQLIVRSGGSVVVLNQVSTSPMEELTRDLTAIITVFSSRIHGLRSNKSKKALAQAISGTEVSIPQVVRCV